MWVLSGCFRTSLIMMSGIFLWVEVKVDGPTRWKWTVQSPKSGRSTFPRLFSFNFRLVLYVRVKKRSDLIVEVEDIELIAAKLVPREFLVLLVMVQIQVIRVLVANLENQINLVILKLRQLKHSPPWKRSLRSPGYNIIDLSELARLGKFLSSCIPSCIPYHMHHIMSKSANLGHFW